MNKNIDLVEILKDCPKGYKLYSTIHGEVKFEQIITGEKYPIVFSYCDIACEYHIGRVTKDGKNMYSCCGECTLFPEKCQRDWTKFKVEPEMVDGEFYYCDYKGGKYIFIYKEKENLYKTNNYAIIKINEPPYGLKQNAPIYCGYLAYFDELRKATEEEKQQLLNTIKRDGYKWDEEKKELVKIGEKFDISTLQPFDKVLVRDDNTQRWKCDFYDSYANGTDYPFRTSYRWNKQCIPYCIGTKHLVGTTEIPPEKYINWEE